ncbi:hypothetical protein Syun_022257 [Stephania yunnanensis]|uniref:Uncharacterized protein n=1 Tax=Stephania yunnanensis TaxID=152371 RepID=A0AAP0IHL7_9MAGN
MGFLVLPIKSFYQNSNEVVRSLSSLLTSPVASRQSPDLTSLLNAVDFSSSIGWFPLLST